MRLVTSMVSESLKAAGARRSELSSRSPTSALLREGRLPEPAKITSSMPEPRMFLNELSPITQRRASTRFDLPQPFGPTTPVSPGSILNSALSQKLLKPVRRKRLNFIRRDPSIRLGAAFCAVHIASWPARIIFARLRHGLAAISESRNQPRRSTNLCETEGSPKCRRRGLVASGSHLRPIPRERTRSPSLGPCLPVAAHPVLERAELLEPNRPARVHAPGGDADLGAEAELSAVGELGRGVVQDDRRIDLLQEPLGHGPVLGHDAVGVMRAVGLDVVDRRIETVDDANGDDRVEIFGAPVLFARRRHPPIGLARGRIAAHGAACLDQGV